MINLLSFHAMLYSVSTEIASKNNPWEKKICFIFPNWIFNVSFMVQYIWVGMVDMYVEDSFI
jgi:hypothetical protein